MPTTDDDSLGLGLEQRLRWELDRARPRFSSPRYLSSGHHRVRTWRFAPAVLGVSLAGILALSAFVATGSPNPVVWTQRVVTVIEANPRPAPVPSAVEHQPAPRAVPTHSPENEAPSSSESGEPGAAPEPRRSGEPIESPDPADSHSDSGSSGGSFQASPAPIDR